MHYCIAAELEGWSIDEHNPYSTNVDLQVDMEEVSQHEESHGLQNYNPIRNICKTVVLTCLNARNKKSAIKGVSHALLKDSRRKDPSTKKFVGLSLKGKLNDLVDDIIDNNTKIGGYFNSDFGIKAQYYESQIAQYCVDRFIDLDSVCLPVHDSLTVKASEVELGLDIMREAYYHVLGDIKNCRIDIEHL